MVEPDASPRGDRTVGSARGARSGRWCRLLGALVLGGLVASCGDERPLEERIDHLALGDAEFDGGNYEQALFHARSAWDRETPDPEVAYLAARTSLALERHRDAIEFVEAGLTADVSSGLRADLEWAQGRAYAALYYELQREADWGAASAALERATRDGRHRVDAACMLAILQGMGGHRDDARLLKFGRMVLELEPQGEYADRVRALFEAQGVKP